MKIQTWNSTGIFQSPRVRSTIFPVDHLLEILHEKGHSNEKRKNYIKLFIANWIQENYNNPQFSLHHVPRNSCNIPPRHKFLARRSFSIVVPSSHVPPPLPPYPT
jgi:hypothetical protein